jgi:hypothetical protein
MNPALVTIVSGKTSAAITGNAATAASLTTPEVTSTPKSTIGAKIAAALRTLEVPGVMAWDVTRGEVVITSSAANIAKIKTWAANLVFTSGDGVSALPETVRPDGSGAQWESDGITQTLANPDPVTAPAIDLLVYGRAPRVTLASVLAAMQADAIANPTTRGSVVLDQTTQKIFWQPKNATNALHSVAIGIDNSDLTIALTYVEDETVTTGGGTGPGVIGG